MNQTGNKYEKTGVRDFVREMLLSTSKWLTTGSNPVRYRIHVVTGDRRGAGTDSNVYVVFHNRDGLQSRTIRPKTVFHNDHERASTTTVEVSKDMTISPPFASVKVWRDNFGNLPPIFGKVTEHFYGGASKRGSAAWFLDRIEVEVLAKADDGKNSVDGRSNIVTKQADGKTYLHPGQLGPGSRTPSSTSINDVTEKFVFPVQRWIEANRQYHIELFDCMLPQADPRPDTRKEELRRKKEEYSYAQAVKGGPVQVAVLPSDEKFSDEYFSAAKSEDFRDRSPHSLEVRGGRKETNLSVYFNWKTPVLFTQALHSNSVAVKCLGEQVEIYRKWTFVTEKAKLLARTKFTKWTTRKWKSLAELRNVYGRSLGEPECLHMQSWDTDEWFGLQRIQGVNPLVIKLCKEIPEKLDVTEETLSGLLGDLTLKEALELNKIFICDLEILEGIACKDNRKLTAPMALFFLKGPDELLPVAIQLHQRKGPQNPVFTPKDSPSTWLVAKMFYNNAEAQHHQGISHLGLTHLLMEGLCVCTHRNLSPSHPAFKLMAPHFLFLLAINARGLEKLISPGGWVDGCMTIGVEGIYEVIRRGIKAHNFYTYGNIEQELKSRNVFDPEILPYYPYRDDALALFDVISKYVDRVIRNHYDTPEKLSGDWEIKEWRQELSRAREIGGVGLIGVPGDDVRGFSTVEELIETITIIIATCSLGHSASNFQQYSQYAFVPNYPGILMMDPPTEKRDYTEEEILDIVPNMETTLETMVITKLLSSRGTKSLGDFEMQYLYHPDDVAAADEFRKDLKKLSLEIQKRNLDRKLKFDWLDPDIVPNAISI